MRIDLERGGATGGSPESSLDRGLGDVMMAFDELDGRSDERDLCRQRQIVG